MKQAVIVDAARTPIGKASAEAGYFRDVRADELSASLLQAIVQRTGIDPHLIEDVRWGCVQQQGEQGYDLGRIAVLMADLPVTVAGVTINRNCGSALQAINDAAMSIMSGCEDVQIAGGVEHMDHIPANKDYDPAPSLFRKHSEAIMNMGLTAEYLAMKYGISRQRQDEFAARSQQSACEATRKGEFAAEIVPTWGRNEIGLKALITTDQGLRSDTTVEGLSKLPPAFNPAGGSVTAGNASQVSVGAAASLIMSEDKARELGLKPLAKIRSMAVVGVAPEEMGIGPAPAIKKALQRAGLKLSDIDCIEVNEAFAVQVLSVLKLLGIDETKVNTRGGAIAIGHPLGASGARVVATLLHRMRDSGAKYGIASLCIGQGQGIATVFEACDV